MAGLTGWWAENPAERYWLEATDRPDIGADLRAPLRDASGRNNWRYTLFRETVPGDVVLHYDSGAAAITSWSRVAGPAAEAPIVWAARGSYARERGAVPESVPGYRVPLTDTQPLATPITLEDLRSRKDELIALVSAVRDAAGGRPVYFPFELSDRPVRPMQGYAFKVPAAFMTLIGLEGPAGETEALTFRLSTRKREVRRHFDRWREAMLETAERDGRLWRLAEEEIVFTNYPEQGKDALGARTAVGVDPLGASWAVQLNEAERAGDANVLTAIALDAGDRPWLLRQGRLQASGKEDEPVSEAQFRARTGATPVEVSNGDTAIERDWYVVTPLDVAGWEIRRRTAAFVELCMLARDRTPASDPEKRTLLETLFAGRERGGSYRVAGRPATDDRDVLRIQGEVWGALEAMLDEHDVKLTKPRPARRYEIDGVVENGKTRLLLEIKCSNAAVDVYTGVGQLMLYRRMLPSLENHTPVLMLPRRPAKAMAAAVEALGVEICTYDAVQKGRKVLVTFPAAVRTLCGLPGGD